MIGSIYHGIGFHIQPGGMLVLGVDLFFQQFPAGHHGTAAGHGTDVHMAGILRRPRRLPQVRHDLLRDLLHGGAGQEPDAPVYDLRFIRTDELSGGIVPYGIRHDDIAVHLFLQFGPDHARRDAHHDEVSGPEGIDDLHGRGRRRGHSHLPDLGMHQGMFPAVPLKRGHIIDLIVPVKGPGMPVVKMHHRVELRGGHREERYIRFVSFSHGSLFLCSHMMAVLPFRGSCRSSRIRRFAPSVSLSHKSS